MSLNIVLTPKLRALAYFSDFREEVVDVPAKPFLKQLLENSLDLRVLSIEDLGRCLETCVYFGLKTGRIVQELLWKIGGDLYSFDAWFTKENGRWFWADDLPAVIKAELAKIHGNALDRGDLTRIGIRCLDPTEDSIAGKGNLRLLRWAHLRRQHFPDRASENIGTCLEAINGGHLGCLKYLCKHGRLTAWQNVQWKNGLCEGKNKKGHLKCLKYAYKQGVEGYAYNNAVYNGHLDCLKFLSNSARENGHYIDWYEETCKNAASRGHLACLKYLHEQGCPWDEWASVAAAFSGSLKCLKYLHEQGCPWTIQTATAAAHHGRLECLKYAHEQDCPWDSRICNVSAQNGHLDCLKYAHEQGCPWSVETCLQAIGSGYLDCLKYLHEQGCPWDESVCAKAFERKNLNCLKYAYEQGCPCDDEIVVVAGLVKRQQ